METAEVDPQQFKRRLEQLHAAWSWPVDSIVLVKGKPSEDGVSDEESRVSAMHLWLLGLEFPEMVIALLKSGKVIFYASQKKLKYLKVIEGPDVVLMARTTQSDLDETQFQALGSTLRAGQDTASVGTLLSEKHIGPFANAFMQALPGLQGVSLVECREKLAQLLAPKDQDELGHTRKSAFCSQFLLTEMVRAKLESVIDRDLTTTNLAICNEISEEMEKEDRMEALLQKHDVDIGDLENVFVSLQSGKSFTIKPAAGASSEEVPMQGTYLFSLAMKYRCYITTIGRTLFVDPTPLHKECYEVVLDVHALVVKSLQPTVLFKDVYLAARTKVKERLPKMLDQFVKDVGFITGLGLRDPLMVLDDRCEQRVESGMVFCVSVGFVEPSGNSWAAWLADTVIVPLKGGANEVATAQCTSKPSDVMFQLSDDPEPAPPAPPVSAARQPEKGQAKSKGKAKAKAPPAAPKPKAKAPAPSRPAPRPEEKPREKRKAEAPPSARAPPARVMSNRTRARNQQTKQDMREQSQLEERQIGLRRQKLAELKERFSGGGSSGTGKSSKQPATAARKLYECEAYSSPSNLPIIPHPNRLRVDDVAEALLVPLRGSLVPFHLSTIKNMARSTNDSVELLRVNFFTPGGGKTLEDFPVVSGRRLYLKELCFRSRSKDNLDAVVRSFKEVQKRAKQREVEGSVRQSADSNSKGPLELLRPSPASLRDLNMRPNFGSNARRTVGTLEAHANGFRFSMKGGAEKVDVLYTQIRHAVYQPCESGSMVVLFHLHLKQPIMCGKRSTQDLQFFTEVAALTEDLSQKRAGSAHDPDEIFEEQREIEMKNRLNSMFLKFSQDVEKIKGCPLSIDIPFKDLSFSGVPNKQVVKLSPCKGALVALQEWPPFCLSTEDVDIVVFERAIMTLREFDLVFVRKDYDQLPVRITTIPSNNMETVRRWLGGINAVWYSCTMNMQWQLVMKEIMRDTKAFVKNGGWDQWFAGAEANSSESGDDQDDESDYKDSEAASDDDSGDSGDRDDFAPDDEEEDADPSSGEDEDGMSWDELEREAERSDRKREAEPQAKNTRSQPPRKAQKKR